ncbi:hypothetical protein NA57DRAFT_74019 [Rhizodiscina lignyota]|uniref:Uncharacterized protein n=1 Tax=Rhizodiscina lignyota TaxID=1504668 RepID=A0A9P4M7G6_9PEZI|nr:hypothetical protein NA57DRAFT_74019 [Rhizodiscina lignyota]
MIDHSNCTNAPSEIPSDAGVAGAGVLLSFIATAFLALILSTWIVLTELRRSSPARITRKLLLSFSDQQIITGIGIQSIALAKMESMVPYHFFLVWMLSSISTATHSAALLALFNDFKRDWVLRWLRQFLMFVNLMLSIVMGILVLENVVKKLDQTLPIACVWHDPETGKRSDVVLSVVGTIALMVGNAAIFVMAVWYLHSGTQKWLMVVRAVALLFLAAIGIGAAVRIIILSQAFGHPSVKLSDDGEKVWSFGQLLPLLLLLLPLVSVVEIFRGEMRVPVPLDDEQRPLYEMDHEFQPNPLWGSRTRLAGMK